jgi:hypothetical protein
LDALLRLSRWCRSIESSYGDGRPSRRIGQQDRDCPDKQRYPIRTRPGDRPPASRVLRSPVKCGAAVRQERPSEKPGGLFLFGGCQAFSLSRAAARHRLAATLLVWRDPLVDQSQNVRRRGVGRAGIERRRRVIFEPELDRFRRLAVEQHRQQRQREIDARSDAAAGDAVAIGADAYFRRRRAEGRKV